METISIGIYNDQILRPHFSQCTYNTYFRFLRTELEKHLDKLTLLGYNGGYFQHDGASLHNIMAVTEYLNTRFLFEKRIGVWEMGQV